MVLWRAIDRDGPVRKLGAYRRKSKFASMNAQSPISGLK
jgi:hypothetical protein